jgi:hypothetical protein
LVAGGISAKTAWTRRKRLGVNFAANQATADFGGGDKPRGGDLNGSNAVETIDYAILRRFWLSSNPAAYIDGNGVVDASDYAILIADWLTRGDPE